MWFAEVNQSRFPFDATEQKGTRKKSGCDWLMVSTSSRVHFGPEFKKNTAKIASFTFPRASGASE